MRVFVGSAAGTPVALTKALAEHGPSLRGKGDKVEVTHIHTEGGGEYMHPELGDVFKIRNFFTGSNARGAIAAGTAQYAPMFLSEIPLLFRRGYIPLDVALITVSPPDSHGYASLGVSVDVVRSAIQCAKTTIAVINPNVRARPGARCPGQIARRPRGLVAARAPPSPRPSAFSPLRPGADAPDLW